jgi:BlaI family penicillinase repressor
MSSERSERDHQPSAGELAILQVLWDNGPSTVRLVHETLDRGEIRYTTTLRTMQTMAEKGLVTRNTDRREHVYTASIAADATQERIVADVVHRVFAGSASRLMVAALKGKPLSDAERDEIRELLEKAGGES